MASALLLQKEEGADGREIATAQEPRQPNTRRNLLLSRMEKGLYSGDEEEALPLNAKARGGFYRWVHRQLKGWWTPRLLLDWAVLVLILVIDVPVSMTTDPYDRFVTAGDPSLSYPLLSDTVREQKSFIVKLTILLQVPTWAVGLMMLAPVCIFLSYQLLMRSPHDFHNACLGLFTALVLTLAVTDAVKLSAGRYRPDWYVT